MNRLLAAVSMTALASPAFAGGELKIFNFGNYTSPEAIAKFEKENDVKVTVSDYDSNDTALAKLDAGGAGFDIVVPSANYVQIFAEKGVIQELDHSKLKNLGNIDPRWMDVDWDPGRKWTIPYLWGSTGVAVNTAHYSGDIDTSEIVFNPPKELEGKVNVLPEMTDVMGMATQNLGVEYCSEDKAAMKKVRDKLMAAKPKWIAMDYGAIEKMTSNDYWASMEWNGAALRTRLANKDVKYGYPKEGYPLFMDSLAITADAQNLENAYKFLDFVMLPENAAMFSEFAKYANGIKGSEQFMSEEMKTSPEVVAPASAAAAGKFFPRCEGPGRELMTAIWTELQK